MTEATPLMQQYFSIKKNYADCFLFFQVGDFYELFFDDAIKAAPILSITLTKRGYHNDQNIPLCGVPVHMVEAHYTKLVKLGHSVAICNQSEPAIPGKVVAREVQQVISPATILQDKDEFTEDSNLMLFFDETEDEIIFIIFEYITLTVKYGNFSKNSSIGDLIKNLISQIRPKEIFFYSKFFEKKEITDFFSTQNCFIRNYCNNNLKDEIKIETQKDIPNKFEYLYSLILESIIKKHISIIDKNIKILPYEIEKFLIVDTATMKHLEILNNIYDGTNKNTLFSTLNFTQTSMGKRLLKQWISYPIIDRNILKERINSIKILTNSINITKDLHEIIKLIGDFERIAGRISLKKTIYKDYQKLINIIPNIARCFEFLSNFKDDKILNEIKNSLWFDFSIYEKLSKYIFEIEEEIKDENLIKKNSDEQLISFSEIIEKQHEFLLEFEKKENEKLGLENVLKIKQTPLYGYTFETSKTKDLNLPKEFKVIQTLSQKERYITNSLKELEAKIINSKEEYKKREKELYNELCSEIFSNNQNILKTAQSIAKLDVLCSLSQSAFIYEWTAPSFESENNILKITSGKHPVLSSILKNNFIENSLELSDQKSKSIIITGPNMGGKSTFMRQNALIIYMAHIGSFVSAKEALIPEIDGIFTRIGASDNVSQGKSTFYVEMEEASYICKAATSKSFVVLDEIGRGTSTYDGMALAASIIEYLVKQKESFILCATHYHEIYTLLSNNLSSKWQKVEVLRSYKGDPFFTYHLKDGLSNESMGIDVAKNVGINNIVINRAYFYKNILESSLKVLNNSYHNVKEDNLPVKKNEYENFIAAILDHNPDSISPREALEIFYSLQKQAKLLIKK
jgi:DNA mismatch repair protein MutS